MHRSIPVIAALCVAALVIAWLQSQREAVAPQVTAAQGGSAPTTSAADDGLQGGPGQPSQGESSPLVRVDTGGAAPEDLEPHPELVEFSGRVVYRNGLPVANANFALQLDPMGWAIPSIDGGTDQEGCFSLSLARRTGATILPAATHQGYILIWDSVSAVFEGLVHMEAGVCIVCEEAPGDPIWDLHGSMLVRPASDEERWIATLWAPRSLGAPPLAIATSECYGALTLAEGVTRLRFLASGYWRHEGPVVLAAYVMEGRLRRPICALRFDSLSKFRDEFQRGLLVSCPSRSVTADTIHGHEVSAVSFLLPGVEFIAVTMTRESGSLQGRLADGLYFARGLVNAGCWGEGWCDVKQGAALHLSWSRVMPGESTLVVRAEDTEGRPAMGASVSFVRQVDGCIVERRSDVLLTGDSGEAHLTGLSSGFYAVEVDCEKEGLSGAGEVEIEGDAVIRVVVQKRSSVPVRLAFSRNMGFDAAATTMCKVWWRQHGQWRRHPMQGGDMGGWVLPGVASDMPLEVAVLAQGWAGVCSLERVRQDSSVCVEMVPVVPVNVIVTPRREGDRTDSVVVKLDYRDVCGPWDEMSVGEAGANGVLERMDARLPSPDLLVMSGGRVVVRVALEATTDRPVRIQLPE